MDDPIANSSKFVFPKIIAPLFFNLFVVKCIFFLSFQRVFLRLLLSLKSQSTEEVDLFFSWVGAEHG